jgi:ribosomal protein L12E/L44/L45/RPP1/RPP2
VFSGGDFQFKDLVARGIYGEILKRDRLGLENELVINKIKENYDNNKSCVENILKSMAKDFDVDFFSPNSMPILEGALSDFDEMFQSEKESIEFLLNGLKKEGYIVSKEYIVDFIFDQRLQNRTNALLEQIEGCVSDYLDTGLALPLIEKIFPESVPETERDAKVFLEEILKNTGKDRLRIALSGKISKKALIRAEEKINKLSEKDENISGVPRAQWVKIIIGHIFYYGEDLGIPDAVMIHVDIQNKRQLTEAFIEKLKFIYREEIKEYKEGFIKEIVSKLVVIPDKSLGLVAEWKNKIKSSIIELRPQERKFKKSFPKVLYSEVFSECTDIFIEKFDMKKAFIKPSYPINTKNIDEASNQAISQLSQALGMDENSPKYMLNYNALIKSYTQVLFEWECGEIKKLLKKAATDVDAINKGLTAKGLIESQLDFVLESAKTTLKAAMAAGGTSLLLGMKPQAMLCFSLLQAMNNSNPLIGISVFTLFYKYILPKILDEKTKYSLEKYEEAVFFAFNMSILPITEFLKNVQSVIQLKFPKNREKLSKMLISFVSALAGAVAFIYCPLIFSEILVAGVVNVSPLIFSYVVARFTFLVSTIFLGISYDDSFEEEIKILLLASLNVEYFQAAELAFLTIFKDFGKESHFLKSLGDFLSKIKNNSKDIQAEAIVHFFEARTLALLADLPLSASDEKLSVINDMMNHLKSLSATILTKVGKNFGNAEENKRDESVEQVLYDIETLLKDAPGRRAGRLRVN